MLKKILPVCCSQLSQKYTMLANSVLVLILSENLFGLSLYHTVCRILECGKADTIEEKKQEAIECSESKSRWNVNKLNSSVCAPK